MSLIDTTYFVRDINLPATTYNTITASIARYERDILIQVLGYDLYKLIAAYDADTSPQRIIDIVTGKEYAQGDYYVKWEGLTNSQKVSPLAYYVYIQYLKDHAVDFQNVGATASNLENGVNVGVGGLIQRASSRMRELVGYPGQDLYAPSLYNFMMEYESTYPEWIYSGLHLENMYGL